MWLEPLQGKQGNATLLHKDTLKRKVEERGAKNRHPLLGPQRILRFTAGRLILFVKIGHFSSN